MVHPLLHTMTTTSSQHFLFLILIEIKKQHTQKIGRLIVAVALCYNNVFWHKNNDMQKKNYKRTTLLLNIYIINLKLLPGVAYYVRFVSLLIFIQYHYYYCHYFNHVDLVWGISQGDLRTKHWLIFIQLRWIQILNFNQNSGFRR